VDTSNGAVSRPEPAAAATAGAVAYRGLAVSYLNELFGNYGGWNDGSVMPSSSYSSKPRTVGTGQGNVFGDVSGYVVLWWGGSCDLLSPSTTQKLPERPR
jgi:hypothetical protein